MSESNISITPIPVQPGAQQSNVSIKAWSCQCGKKIGVEEPLYGCCGDGFCRSCYLKHHEATPEQLAKQTPFCLSMHLACAADGMVLCPTCGVHMGAPLP